MGKNKKKSRHRSEQPLEIADIVGVNDDPEADAGKEWPLYCLKHHCHTHLVPNLEGTFAYVCFGKEMNAAELQKLKRHKPEPNAHLLAANGSLAWAFLPYAAPEIISPHLVDQKQTMENPPYYVPFAVESYPIDKDAWPHLVRNLQKAQMQHR